MERQIQDGLLRGLTGVYSGSELLSRFSEHIQSLVGSAETTARSGDEEAHFADLLALESLLLCDLLSDREAQEVVDMEGVQAAAEVSRRLFTTFESRLEDAFAADIKRVRTPERYLSECESVTRNYLARYRGLAAAEVALADIGANDHVAFVGAGCLPITALEYVRTTGCRVDGIEIIETRTAEANVLTDRLGLASQMTVLTADGRDIDFAKYNVILIGVLAEPKVAICARIAATADAGTRIICRTTSGLRQLIYRPTASASLLPYRVQAINRARGFQTLSTLRLGLVSLRPEGGV